MRTSLHPVKINTCGGMWHLFSINGVKREINTIPRSPTPKPLISTVFLDWTTCDLMQISNGIRAKSGGGKPEAARARPRVSARPAARSAHPGKGQTAHINYFLKTTSNTYTHSFSEYVHLCTVGNSNLNRGRKYQNFCNPRKISSTRPDSTKSKVIHIEYRVRETQR